LKPSHKLNHPSKEIQQEQSRLVPVITYSLPVLRFVHEHQMDEYFLVSFHVLYYNSELSLPVHFYDITIAYIHG